MSDLLKQEELNPATPPLEGAQGLPIGDGIPPSTPLEAVSGPVPEEPIRIPAMAGRKKGQRLVKPAEEVQVPAGLTPEQRLLIALDLSGAAAALHHACSKKR